MLAPGSAFGVEHHLRIGIGDAGAQRRGYVRHTLKEDVCDIWSGVVSGAEMMTSTRSYYRSSYVFVTRADRGLKQPARLPLAHSSARIPPAT